MFIFVSLFSFHVSLKTPVLIGKILEFNSLYIGCKNCFEMILEYHCCSTTAGHLVFNLCNYLDYYLRIGLYGFMLIVATEQYLAVCEVRILFRIFGSF